MTDPLLDSGDLTETDIHHELKELHNKCIKSACGIQEFIDIVPKSHVDLKSIDMERLRVDFSRWIETYSDSFSDIASYRMTWLSANNARDLLETSNSADARTRTTYIKRYGEMPSTSAHEEIYVICGEVATPLLHLKQFMLDHPVQPWSQESIPGDGMISLIVDFCREAIECTSLGTIEKLMAEARIELRRSVAYLIKLRAVRTQELGSVADESQVRGMGFTDLAFPAQAKSEKQTGIEWTDWFQTKVAKKWFEKHITSKSGWTDFANKLRRENRLKNHPESGDKVIMIHVSVFTERGMGRPDLTDGKTT